jgi:PAS domain-containing protein
MPEMDGLEFLKKVRDRDKQIPFILFTGHGREDVVIEACHAGVSCYLQKGGDPNPMFFELEHRIEQAVDKYMAEKELMTKNLQANLAMDLAGIATWEYDPQTTLFKFDDIFFSLYGTDVHREGVNILSMEEYISKFIFPEDMHTVVAWIQKAEKSDWKGHAHIEHRIVRRSGEVRWVATNIGALYNMEGRLEKLCGVVQDITEQKARRVWENDWREI